MLFHQFFKHQHCADINRHAGVVALAVSRSSRDDRVVISDAGLLRGARNAVYVGDECDHRLTAAVCGDPRRGNPGRAVFHFESIFLQNPRYISRSLKFLKAQFAVAEDLIDHLLREGL